VIDLQTPNDHGTKGEFDHMLALSHGMVTDSPPLMKPMPEKLGQRNLEVGS
jgi:hypothetical protein